MFASVTNEETQETFTFTLLELKELYKHAPSTAKEILDLYLRPSDNSIVDSGTFYYICYVAARAYLNITGNSVTRDS